MSALQHWYSSNHLPVVVWRQCWQGVCKWRQTVCQHCFSDYFRTYYTMNQKNTLFFCIYRIISLYIRISLYPRHWVAAKQWQYHCKTCAVTLQNICSITAKHMQYHCKAYAVTMQSICSTTATYVQQRCNTDTTLYYF